MIFPLTKIPAFFNRFASAFPKKTGGLSIVIGVDHHAGRSGTVPETVTASDPDARDTATRTRPLRPTVRARGTGRRMSTGGSIDTATPRPGRAPGRIDTST